MERKVSNLVSSPVISLYEAKEAGSVENIVLDAKLKKITGLIIFDEINNQKYYLNTKNIYSMSKIEENFCIYIKNMLFLKNELPIINNPINKQAYILGEEKLGYIKDILLEDFLVKEYICSSGKSFLPENIFSANEIIIFSKNKIKKSNFAPKNKKILLNNQIINLPTVKIMPIEITSPPKLMVSKLIGKVAKENIIGYSGELIIKKGQRLTPELIKRATEHGVLAELFR